MSENIQKKTIVLVAALITAVTLYPNVGPNPIYAAKTIVCTAGDGCGVEDDGCQCSYQLAMRMTLPQNTTLSISGSNDTSLVEELTRQIVSHPTDNAEVQISAILEKADQLRLPINDTILLEELQE